MQKQLLFSLLLSSLTAMPLQADNLPVGGYLFGQDVAPTGQEWQNPGMLGYNKLPLALFSLHSRLLARQEKYCQNLQKTTYLLTESGAFTLLRIPMNAQKTSL